MILEVIKSIIFNVSLLVLSAHLLTKIKPVRHFIISDKGSLGNQFFAAVIFGLTGILSTYAGLPVEGAIANARVVSVIAGGLIGGPFTGILAGLIAGTHRFLIDVGGFTAFACMISTVMEGLLGGLLSKRLKKSSNRLFFALMTAASAEFLQMVLIVALARPLDKAVELVKIIGVPMIVFNSLGVVVFLGVLYSVLWDHSKEAAKSVGLVLDIADRCLPYMRKGLHSTEDLEKAADLILRMSHVTGAAIADTERILAVAGSGGSSTADCSRDDKTDLSEDDFTEHILKKTIDGGSVEVFPNGQNGIVVCAPIAQSGKDAVGALILYTKGRELDRKIECEFAGGLARLFATQLELSQVEYQKKLLQKAEAAALQSQINPHFLFNALTTITAFCREKPERARELLLQLSRYFRNTLNTHSDMISLYDEMEHVHAYVELEKARFEDKLEIEENIPPDIRCTMPGFTIQPLVENAVKHGAIKRAFRDGKGKVIISAADDGSEVSITIWDNGPGIADATKEMLFQNRMPKDRVGLSNVHQRLKSIYGEQYGLSISSDESGCTVTVRIPKGRIEGDKNEICSG